MKKIEIIKTGRVVMFDSKFWGCQYDDGHATVYDFGSIENARISKTLILPEHFSSYGSKDVQKLRQGKIVNIKITTTYEVEDL